MSNKEFFKQWEANNWFNRNLKSLENSKKIKVLSCLLTGFILSKMM